MWSWINHRFDRIGLLRELFSCCPFYRRSNLTFINDSNWCFPLTGYNVAQYKPYIFQIAVFVGSYGLVTAARQGSCRPRFCTRVNFARIPIERSTPLHTSILKIPLQHTWLIFIYFILSNAVDRIISLNFDSHLSFSVNWQELCKLCGRAPGI